MRKGDEADGQRAKVVRYFTTESEDYETISVSHSLSTSIYIDSVDG